jgi:uncharacterized protein YcnI
MKRNLCLAILALTVPSLAMAHVSVRLEIPTDVVVMEVLPAEGATFETAKAGDRVTGITWKKEIAPKQAARFVFRARNPSSGP